MSSALLRRSLVQTVAKRTLSTSPTASLFELSEEVRSAINSNTPVVALESTVVTHGLPFPDNLQTAKWLERDVREHLAIPATIALIEGKIKVGLTEQELHMIADPKHASVKVSVRDMANVLEKGLIGGTTVAATMRIAHACGIKVFATGGIGGVHRGAENTFDISADLVELGRTPVAVVCAGAKSILDVAKTLEFLETQSCNVIVYGTEPYFPGFFTRKTREKAPFLTDNLNEIANILAIGDKLKLNHGTLIACPPPNDEGEQIEQFIQQAVQECGERKIGSKEVTPYILNRVSQLTGGRSKDINIALLRNNAKIAANLARLYSELKKTHNTADNGKNSGEKTRDTPPSTPKIKSSAYTSTSSASKKPKILAVGAAIVDFEVLTDEDVKDDGGSYKGTIIQRCGGVGRNHADALGRLGCESTLLTSIGDDEMGQFLLRNARHYSMEHVHTGKHGTTATYMSVNVKGSIVHGFSSVEEAVSRVTPEYIKSKEDLFVGQDYVVADGNLTKETLDVVIRLAGEHSVKVWFEPTDIAKADKIIHNDNYAKTRVLSPNFNEMNQYVKHFEEGAEENLDQFQKLINSDFLSQTSTFKTVEKMLNSMKAPEAFFLLTLSSIGVLAFEKKDSQIRHFHVPPPSFGIHDRLVSVSGAGDCFNSGFLAAHLHGKSFEECLDAGMLCVQASLRDTETVPETITPQLIGV